MKIQMNFKMSLDSRKTILHLSAILSRIKSQRLSLKTPNKKMKTNKMMMMMMILTVLIQGELG